GDGSGEPAEAADGRGVGGRGAGRHGPGIGRGGQVEVRGQAGEERLVDVQPPAGRHRAVQRGQDVDVVQDVRLQLGGRQGAPREDQGGRARGVRRRHGGAAEVVVEAADDGGQDVVARGGQVHLGGAVVGEPGQLVGVVGGRHRDHVGRIVVGRVERGRVVVGGGVPGGGDEQHVVVVRL